MSNVDQVEWVVESISPRQDFTIRTESEVYGATNIRVVGRFGTGSFFSVHFEADLGEGKKEYFSWRSVDVHARKFVNLSYGGGRGVYNGLIEDEGNRIALAILETLPSFDMFNLTPSRGMTRGELISLWRGTVNKNRGRA